MKLRKLQKKMNQKGFTLIELIIVIAILGILAALAIPRFLGFTDNAELATDENYCGMVAEAVGISIAEGAQSLPTTGNTTTYTGVANIPGNADVGNYTFQSARYGGDLAAANIPTQANVGVAITDAGVVTLTVNGNTCPTP
jgi:type IV pilus assembly protein PilA